jgi:hypothetical protein
MTHRLIPTTYKSKIPQGFSYPLGAEIISEALAGVPQYEQLSIRFSSYNVRSRGFQRLITTRELWILQIHFYVESIYPWKITVGTLPSEHKHTAQEALKAILPEVHRWLSVLNPERVQHSARISFLYNLKTGLLSRQDYPN